MQEESLSKQAKKLEKYIYTLPHAKQLNKLSRGSREVMISLQDSAFNGRRAVEIYSSSDDTKEQLIMLEEAILSLKKLNESLLLASEYDLIDMVDLAHLSALNDSIIDQVKG